MKVRSTPVVLALLLLYPVMRLPVRAQEVPEVSEAEPIPEPPTVEEQPEAPGVPPREGLTREDVLWAARLCAHEATWAGREGGAPDCGGIVQVILNRMTDAPRETFTRRLALTTPRFWRGTTTRSWARHLEAGPIRGPLPGWPATWPAASNFTDRWHSVYVRTHAFMTGREGLPCQGTPVNWFSIRVDSRQIAERLATGRFRRVECAGDERNAFLERVTRPTTPPVEVVEVEQIVLGG